MSITHVFFDMYGTLADSERLIPAYARCLGLEMTERYGGSPEAWANANRRIVADWDSYYADLDLAGENGLDDMWEGLRRTTRALFRLTGTPEPPAAELTALSRELPYLAARNCDALFPDVRPAAEALRHAGLILGVASHAISGQLRGMLHGGGIIHLFTGPILAPDVTGTFAKNRAFYLAAGLPPETCAVVEDSEDGLAGAKDAGMMTVHLRRGERPALAADHTITDLTQLLPLLKR